MNTTKLWTKDFLLLALVNFCVAINFYLLMVIISVHAMEKYASPPSEAGLASSIFIIGTLIARLFAGKMIERTGRKRMLYGGLIFNLLLSLLYYGVNSIPALFLVRFLHGASFGIASTATGTIVASIIPRERHGEGIGYFMLSVTLATAIGPFLGMLMNQKASFSYILALCAGFIFVSVVCALFLHIPEIELTETQLNEAKSWSVSSFFERKALRISFVCAFIYICYSSVLSFLGAYVQQINLVNAASFFFIVYAGSILVSRPFTGRLFDARGENVIMYPAMLVFALGMALLSQAQHGITLLAAAACLGLGLGTIQSSSQAIALKVTPLHRMGLANSTFFMFLDAGTGIGPFLLGFLIPLAGYRGMYLDLAALALVSMLLYYLLHGRIAVQRKLKPIG